MKKITLVFALTFCLVLFAGCTKTGNNNIDEWNSNPEDINIEENVPESQEEDSSELTTLYNNWWQLTCKVETMDPDLWDVVSISYINNDKILNYTTYTDGWKPTSLYVLTQDWKQYIRWDAYWEWNWIVVDAQESVQEIIDYYEGSTSEDINCTPGVEWISFDLPENINFAGITSFTY